MSVGEANRSSFDTSTVCDRYEQLRRIAFGESLLPEDRVGLLLFLRFGMWRWACSVDAMTIERKRRLTTAATLSVPTRRAIVVYLLAQVAMATNRGRVQ
jgi:hypothetical protein